MAKDPYAPKAKSNRKGKILLLIFVIVVGLIVMPPIIGWVTGILTYAFFGIAIVLVVGLLILVFTKGRKKFNAQNKAKEDWNTVNLADL